jgi:hypothetical protein
VTTSPASAGTSSASCQVCRALAGRTRDSAFGLGREDPLLARSSATRLSQRRFRRGRAPDTASGEVTLRPTLDLLQCR